MRSLFFWPVAQRVSSNEGMSIDPGGCAYDRFSSSASFDCPLTESDITGFLGSSGLSGLLNSGSSKVRQRRNLALPSGSDGDDAASSDEGEDLYLRTGPAPPPPTEAERRAMHLATRHALAKLVERANRDQFGGGKLFVADRTLRIGTVQLGAEEAPPPSA